MPIDCISSRLTVTLVNRVDLLAEYGIDGNLNIGIHIQIKYDIGGRVEWVRIVTLQNECLGDYIAVMFYTFFQILEVSCNSSWIFSRSYGR